MTSDFFGIFGLKKLDTRSFYPNAGGRDLNGNIDCDACIDCVDCEDCSGCVNCIECVDCVNCTDCLECSGLVDYIGACGIKE